MDNEYLESIYDDAYYDCKTQNMYHLNFGVYYTPKF